MRRTRFWLVALLLVIWGGGAMAAPPTRVVSINLCLDQFALALAAPGQVVSVSALAADPKLSPRVAEAQALPLNRGQAEEIFLMRPDLVLAGRFAAREAVQMLQRLGVRVVVFDPPMDLAGIRATIVELGALLGREAAAAAMLAQFDADLVAAAATPRPGRAPVMAVVEPSMLSPGAGSLADQVLKLAGFENLASRNGIQYLGVQPLETVILSGADALGVGRDHGGARSRAEAVVQHPALTHAFPPERRFVLDDRDWICGTERTAAAAARLARARLAVFPDGAP